MADHDFDDFYASNYGRFVVQLYAVTGSLPDAEDAVQEAFARASVHWGRVRAYEMPEAWVRRVALNVAFTGLRRARRVVEVLTRAEPPPAAPLPGASVELVEALGRLPLHFRQVLVLHYLADLPVERVAGELGIAVGTAKSRLARARDALAARGAARWTAQPDLQPVSPPPTTRPAVVPSTNTAPATSATAPVTTGSPTTSTPPRPTGTVVLRADGLGVAAFGTAEGDALRALQDRLGPTEERGSWSGATPFGTCPGPVRAARWGRLYVLFTSGPTRYDPAGRWHLFAYQVDAVQRTTLDPQYSGPPPTAPPPLRGYSPRTAAGIGFGSTVAELRGSLTGDTPGATVTFLAAGAVCGE